MKFTAILLVMMRLGRVSGHCAYLESSTLHKGPARGPFYLWLSIKVSRERSRPSAS